MFLAWKPTMAIDHGIIDDDHRYLIELMNGVLILILNKAPKGAIGAMLRTLHGYAAEHFRREEILQKASDYPDFEGHHVLHTRLLRDLRHFISELERDNGGTMDEVAYSAYLADTKKFLARWLLSHIMDEDVKMRPWSEQMAYMASTMLPLSEAYKP